MELVIKKPYIEIFEKVLKLFTVTCDSIHLHLTRHKLELSGTNNLTHKLIIQLDKTFFKYKDINNIISSSVESISGTVNSKDIYNSLFSYNVVKLLKSCHSNIYNSRNGNDIRRGSPSGIINTSNNYNIMSKNWNRGNSFKRRNSNSSSSSSQSNKRDILLSKIILNFNNT
ncbi:conserved protein, unknown function, partial [Hepatocystis sp. ex Piliocolobus tephrosceles]